MESDYDKIREIDMGDLSIFNEKYLIPFKYILALGKLQEESKEANNTLVADKMGSSPATAKKRGKELEEKGLVKIDEGDSDQDFTTHQLTEEGEDVFESLEIAIGNNETVEEIQEKIIEIIRDRFSKPRRVNSGLKDLEQSKPKYYKLRPEHSEEDYASIYLAAKTSFRTSEERHEEIRNVVARELGKRPDNDDFREKYAKALKNAEEEAPELNDLDLWYLKDSTTYLDDVVDFDMD